MSDVQKVPFAEYESAPDHSPTELRRRLRARKKRDPIIMFEGQQLSAATYVKFLNNLNKRLLVSYGRCHDGYLVVPMHSAVLQEICGRYYKRYIELAISEGIIDLAKEYSVGFNSRHYYVDTTNLRLSIVRLTQTDKLSKELLQYINRDKYKTWKADYQRAVNKGISKYQLQYMRKINKRAMQRYNDITGDQQDDWITIYADHDRIYTAAGCIKKDMRDQCIVDDNNNPLVEFDMSSSHLSLLAHHLSLPSLASYLSNIDQDIYIEVGRRMIQKGGSTLLDILDSLDGTKKRKKGKKRARNRREARDRRRYKRKKKTRGEVERGEDKVRAAVQLLCLQLRQPNQPNPPLNKGDYEIQSQPIQQPSQSRIRAIGKLSVNAGLNQKSTQRRVNPTLKVVLDTISEVVDKQEAEEIKNWHKGIDYPAFYDLATMEWKLIQVAIGGALADADIPMFTIHDAFFVEGKDVNRTKDILRSMYWDGALGVHPSHFGIDVEVKEMDIEEEEELDNHKIVTTNKRQDDLMDLLAAGLDATVSTDALEADLGVDMTTDTWMQRESILDASSWQQTGISDDTPRPDTPDKINNNQDQLLDLLRSRLISSSRDLN